jgi:Transglycosylase SLT domain
MDTVVTIATLFAVAIIALLLVLGAVRGLDRWVFPGLSFEQALRENNLSVAVFLAALVFGIFFLMSHAVAGELDRYDGQFRKWGRYRFGYACDWRYFKAQGVTESGLRPEACSAVGACGVMQLMPGTALAMGLRSRLDAKASIRAGIAYDRRVWDVFGDEAGLERLWFAFAGYNCGPGCVIRAQGRAARWGGSSARWSAIRPYLPAETRAYVPRIRAWRERFVARPARGLGPAGSAPPGKPWGTSAWRAPQQFARSTGVAR